ncbi:DUF2889 domain-containing protein [Massilia arenosa]|uniref:DUF2889 domain-containing protein n=1 Tax=Zemynaea arenosa TaxID=2561931 RepID=A0A4Y9SM29_9BURK|nr:DUF2889 domain-containing protein [Massilia arenosa]TFW25494.1 DUF2889 domain-containing protein [Massilia arenosa]
MPLSPPVPREPRHTRAIEVQAFARADGLWDLDARITDVKVRDVQLASGLRPGGTLLHDLSLRLTIDLHFTVVDAEACSDAVPYPGYCDVIGPAYKSLIGCNLMQGFRAALKERLGGTLGCTHLTELAQVLPTAAVQAFANDVLKTRDGDTDDAQLTHKPFQIDRCHALASTAPAVAKFYPRWSVKASNGSA